MRNAHLIVLFVPLAACGSTMDTSQTTSGGGGRAETATSSSSSSVTSSAGDASSTSGTSSASSSSSTSGATIHPPDPCIESGTCPPGQWIDVTPQGVDLVNGACGNFGTKAVQIDPKRPQDVYVEFNCQGIWKSTDYGRTFQGPINTGMNGAAAGNCAGVVSIAPGKGDAAPVLYESCIRDSGDGAGVGFWRSDNGGVDWTRYQVAAAPAGGGQQFYAPAVDPYDGDHLLMAGHATDLLVESADGGKTWTAIHTDPKMALNGGTGGINFINTGDAKTTRTTWLWLASQSGGTIGTWRTENSGTGWTHVESNEHTNGSMHSEVYQPGTDGVMFMAGTYSSQGDGVLRSADYGKTWVHVGLNAQEAVVFGTSKNVYAMFGWAPGPGEMVDPALEIAPAPGTGTWSMPGTPSAMTQGPGQSAVTNDGTYNIILVGNYNAGLWRYVEPL